MAIHETAPAPVILTDSGGDELAVDASGRITSRIVDASGDAIELNADGHLDVVSHGHPEGGSILFKKDFSASEDLILIDLSDTTNYPHDNTGWLHTHNMVMSIAGDVSADYVIQLGFLENVDATDGDFYEIFSIDGSKKAGNSATIDINQAPEAPRLISSRFLGPIELNQTAFQTDVNLASTLDPATADTPSGDGDMVMRVTRNAGVFSVALLLGYHSHA